MMLRLGMYLQERYEILDQIGSGGMSEVYRAKCHKLNRLVAIKVLKEEFSQDSNFVSKFKMEAQAAAGLSHPNIVSVYDVVDDGDLHYIVMELIEGITLKSYILKKGQLGVKETIGIAIQVAQGIAAAHDQHIVHRDIKPQNIIISRDGKVKVADFGIARAVSTQTVGVAAVGSVHYISPEQARGGYSDSRSDIYSLGITMYEMLTGTVPFDGENTVTIALAHLEEMIPSPRDLNHEVTRSLERIILKCTQKKPDRRYQDAYELVADLRHALVDPDDEYLMREPEFDESSPTVIIGGDELEAIKEGPKQPEAGENYLPGDYSEGYPENYPKNHPENYPENYPEDYPEKYLPDEYPPGEYSGEAAWEAQKRKPAQLEVPPIRRQPGKKNTSKKTPPKKEPDLSPKIEKILTLVGIAAAVLIAVIVIVFVVKLSGIFNAGSGEQTAKITESSATAAESLKSTECLVPNVIGMKSDEAAAALEKQSLTAAYEYEDSDDSKKDLVIRQSVDPDTVAAKQTKVTLTIGKGSGQIDLSALGLETMTADEAQAALKAQGFDSVVKEEASDTVDKDKVIRYEPQKAAKGDSITIFVSSGPAVPMTRVPNLSGKTESEAQTILETLKLVMGTKTEQKSADVPKGKIITQDVAPDTDVPEGTVVNYTLSIGKGTKYVAAVNDDYPLRDMFGPSSGDTKITVEIVMKQMVGGKEVTKVIMQPREMSGDITIPVHYNIEGADGVLTGTLQILDLTNNKVLKTYPLEFVEVDE